MRIHQQEGGASRVMGLALVMGLLMSGSIAFAEDPLAVKVPLDPDDVQRAVVEVDSYAFIPPQLIVKSGKPVALTFRSITWIVPHNVIIDDPLSGLHIREEIPAGTSLTITFIPTVPGSFAIYCDKQLPFLKSHREKGQEGVLSVR